jgi:hypothetical protein
VDAWAAERRRSFAGEATKERSERWPVAMAKIVNTSPLLNWSLLPHSPARYTAPGRSFPIAVIFVDRLEVDVAILGNVRL